ncbi:hypothetical protein MUK42_34286 [Musa troglodytarum]|uniref:Uncharacterized protein n=1 Tax=Musa troglodytarum TaxID=320322 RepID=A0A9E7F7I8_9LILI|nr:hypothetical protein MUK42_34286 [Musa troglodytarum]
MICMDLINPKPGWTRPNPPSDQAQSTTSSATVGELNATIAMHANHMQGLQLSSNPCTIPTAFPTPSTPTAPRSSPPPSSAHISSSAARPCSRPRRRYPYHNQKRPRLMISSSHGVGVFQGKKITKTKPRKRARKRRPPLLVVKGGNLPPLKQQIRFVTVVHACAYYLLVVKHGYWNSCTAKIPRSQAQEDDCRVLPWRTLHDSRQKKAAFYWWFLSMCVAMAIVFLPPHQILDSRTMGDHLALLVDHLLTESTLEAAIGNGKQAQIAADSASSGDLGNNSTPDTSVGRRTPSGKLVECRICQEDDQDSNMEIPCSCCGSLKQFKPGYTALPKLFHYGRAPMNFRYLLYSILPIKINTHSVRGSWDTSSQDLHDPQILTVVPSGVIESNYYDHLASRLRSTICCRSVTIIFMILLVLRHTLPLIKGGAEQYSFTLFSLLVLRTAGILIPIFFIAGTLTTFHHSRRRQVLARLCNSANVIFLIISSREYVNEVLPFTCSLRHISTKPTGNKQIVELVTNYVKLQSRRCHNEGNI